MGYPKACSPKVAPALALGLATALVATVSCARVSPQAVVLADVVGQRLTAIQASHEAFVRGYFDHSRQRVEGFLTDEWTPRFLERFVADPAGTGEGLLDLLATATPFDDDEIARLDAALAKHGVADRQAVLAALHEALGGGEQGAIVLEVADAAIRQIDAKRRSLLDPIDRLERDTLAELRSAYGQVQQAQGSVTTHLRSLVAVQEGQDQALARLGLLEKRDAAMARALAANERIVGVLDAGEDVWKTLTALEHEVRALDLSEGSH